MKLLDIIVRSGLFLIILFIVFYVIPKIMIPDVIKEFKKVFGKQPEQQIEVVAGYKGKKKLWDKKSTIDISV